MRRPRRSIVATVTGIEKATQALKRLNYTKKALALELGLAASTVNNFFRRTPIYRTNFEEICRLLGLHWQDIVTSVDQLWEQLQTFGTVTEKMGLVVVREQTLGWGWPTNSIYEKSVQIGSYIRVEVNFDISGYLLLLQRDTSGKIWCFCPSCFAPQPHLDTGKTCLPQEESEITCFPIEGTPGKEEILALITPTILSYKWLPQANDEPIQLQESHLNELLNYVNNNQEYKILYTEYMVTE
jgi:DNA-binding Xre family transcriptional regulator